MTVISSEMSRDEVLSQKSAYLFIRKITAVVMADHPEAALPGAEPPEPPFNPRRCDFVLRSSPKTYQNYKSKPPEETLQWIQEVLKPYFPPSMLVGLQPNEFGSTWFCRVSLLHAGIGQNGKGATIPLALASGFAEFMERLQALYLFRNFSNNLPRLMMLPDTPPDTERGAWKEFNTLFREEMNDRLPEDGTAALKSTFYQFYDVLNGNNPVYLDKSLTYTPFFTTGTAAGNTREEAIVQALCELFERYAARKIVENRMVVPSIPWHLLSERIQNMLHEIQNAGFEVHVKDFSLGIGLPAVCVMVGTPEAGYHARPGCAPDINVAVERCILEFYQGMPSTMNKIASVRDLTERWNHLYTSLSDYVKSHFTLDEFIIVNFLNAYDFPPDDLKFLTKDAPGFIPWNYSHEDFYEELQILLNLCKKNEFRLYMRDISWMGFPTVQVFSPDLKVQEYNSIERRVFFSNELKQFQSLLLGGIDAVRTPQFYELIHTPEVLYFCMVVNPPRVDSLRGLMQEGPFWYMNSWHFLGLVAYYFQDMALAKCFFQCYRVFNPQDEYSLCLIQAVELLPDSPWEGTTVREDVLESVRNELSKTFSPPTVKEVLSDLTSPKAVLDIVSGVLTPCGECESCHLAQLCSYGRLVPILERVQKNFPNVLHWEKG